MITLMNISSVGLMRNIWKETMMVN